MDKQSLDGSISFTTFFTWYIKPAVEAYYSEKYISFKLLLLIDNVPGHSRALIEMLNKMNIAFTPANTTTIL